MVVDDEAGAGVRVPAPQGKRRRRPLARGGRAARARERPRAGRLAVIAGNARARRFYERNGWHDEGEFDYEAAGESGPIVFLCHRYVKESSARRAAARTPSREPARSSAAPTKSRKSGAGRVGRDLNSGWNWLATNQGWSGSSTISTSRPPGTSPRRRGQRRRAAGGARCSPRSGGGAARGRQARRSTPAPACRRPARPPGHRAASSRRGPRSPSARGGGR